MTQENMKRKTKKEVQKWAANKKTKKGEKLVVADESTTSSAVARIKKEVEIL